MDSVGEFTVNPARALEQMGRFQLTDPGLWVVKLVQAAVALGASRIEFNLDYRRTTVRFYDTPPVDGADLARSMLSGELPSEPWKRHLVVGLRAFHGQSPRSLSWTDSSGTRVMIEGTELEVSEPGQAGTPETLKVVAELTLVPHRLDRLPMLFQQTLAEHVALSQRCSLCHLPILVDGRLVSRQFPPRPPGGGRGLYPPVLLALRGAGPEMPIMVQTPSIPLSTISSFPEPSSEVQTLAALALFYVPVVMLSEVGTPLGPVSYCYPVKDGALLNSRRVRFPFISKTTALRYVLHLFLNATDSEVDLSEFEPLRLELEGVKRALRETVEGIDFAADAVPLVRVLHQQSQEQVAAEHKRAMLEAIEGLELD